MKRITTFLCLLMLAVTLSACSNSGSATRVETQMRAELEEHETSSEPAETTSAETTDAETTGIELTDAESTDAESIDAESADTEVSAEESGQESMIQNEPELPETAASEQAVETSPAESEEPKQVSSAPAEDDFQVETEEEAEMKLTVQVDGTTFSATLENNAAVDAFVEMMEQAPVVIEMSDYSGFEKVGSLGQSLPASNSQMTTQAGDIVLYNGNQIVIFYGSNSWSYTRLGKIDDLSGWEEALGSGDVTVTFSIGG